MSVEPQELQLHTFRVQGMTCQQCVKRVRETALLVEGTQDVQVFLDSGKLLVWAMPTWHANKLQEALQAVGYASQLQGSTGAPAGTSAEIPLPRHASDEASGGGYFPLYVTFAQILAVSAWAAWTSDGDSMARWHRFMTFSMAGYFLVFGLFKVISRNKFSELFQRYDLLARQSRIYAKSFPFLEWTAGWAYLLFPHSPLLHGTVLVWMILSAIGPLQVIFRKEQIRCACLGDALGQPVGWVTVGEIAAMALMAAAMLFF